MPINNNLISEIKCFYHKRSNTYLLIFRKVGIIFKNKGKDSTFIVSTEKKFLKKNKSMKVIKYDDAMMEIAKTLLNFTENKPVIASSDEIDLFYNVINSILEKNKELTEWDNKDPFESSPLVQQ